MRSQRFPMKVKKKHKDEQGVETEVEVTETIDGQLRPYQLWGYVLPEEYVEPMCNSLDLAHEQSWFNMKPGEQKGSFMSGFGVKGYLEALRLGLGAKKIPKFDKAKGFWSVPIYRKHINILTSWPVCKYHRFGNAEFHFAWRQICQADHKFADKIMGLIGPGYAGKNPFFNSAQIQLKTQQLIGSFDRLG